jgi:hypothetical protein
MTVGLSPTAVAKPTADMTALLSHRWQSGLTGPTLSLTKDKLEKHCGSYRRNRRAAAAVEFTVGAPVSHPGHDRIWPDGHGATGDHQCLARRCAAAALDGSTTADVTTNVNDYLTSDSIGGATVTVAPNPPTDAEFGEPVTVAVSIPFNQVSWLLSPMYLGGKTLSATTVMRRESVQQVVGPAIHGGVEGLGQRQDAG